MSVEQHDDERILEPQHENRIDRITDFVTLTLSHHPREQYGHCVRILVGRHAVYLCGRCTGIYSGLILGILAFFVFGIIPEPSWLWFGIAVIIGMATVVDWMTQRLTPRKTTVRVRFVTGIMSGVGLAIIFVLGNLFYLLIAMIVMFISIGSVSLIQARQ